MLVLASRSPRRQELLLNAGIPFVVRVADVPEVLRPEERPASYVRRLAFEKASAVEKIPQEMILGADTVVVSDGAVLEKPRDAEHACAMLRQLSGRQHEVITGVCLLRGDEATVEHAVTTVRFTTIDDEEIEEYVATGEPMDKAGAYAIQGRASRWVERIEGEYANVVGLPVALVYRMLRGTQ